MNARLEAQEKVAKVVAETPAETFQGVAHKLRWMSYNGNDDTDKEFTPGKVFRSIMDDVKRLNA